MNLCQVWWQSDHSAGCEALLPVLGGNFMPQEVTSCFMMSLPVCLSRSPCVSERTYQVWWQSDHSPACEASLPVLGGHFLSQEVTSGFMMSFPVCLVTFPILQ